MRTFDERSKLNIAVGQRQETASARSPPLDARRRRQSERLSKKQKNKKTGAKLMTLDDDDDIL